MGIQILPSTGDAIAGTIKDLAAGIDKFINPNKDLQLAVQRTVATNPELLQHMADMEANAPGTMGRLGLGNLAPIIAAIPQSAAATAEAATRPRAAEQATATQGAAIATANTTTSRAGLTGEVIQKAGKIMAADPSISFDAALKTLGLDTQSERTVADTKAKVATAEGDLTLQAALRARQLPEDLSKIDWTTEASSFLDGDLPGSAAAAYFGNKDTREAFTTAIHSIMTQRQIDATAAWRASRGTGVDNLEKRQAFTMYTRTGGTANLQSWRDYLFNPEKRQRAEELLVSGAEPKTDEDKALLAIARVNREQKNTLATGEVLKVNSAIKKSLDDIDKADTPQNREQLINSLNIALKRRAEFGGMDVVASWDDQPWYKPGFMGGGDKLIFKDRKTGKIIDGETVNSVITDPQASDIRGPELSPVAQKSLQAILALPPAQREAAKNKMRMQFAKRPEVIKEIDDAFKRIDSSTKTGFQGMPIDSTDLGGDQ